MSVLEKFGYKKVNQCFVQKMNSPIWDFSVRMLVIISVGIAGSVILVLSLSLFSIPLSDDSSTDVKGMILIFGSIIISLLIMSLLAPYQTTTIDVSSRTATIIRRRLIGRKRSVQTLPLDQVVVEATRMGVSDASPHDTWYVKAGYVFEESALTLCTKETESAGTCRSLLLELYRFFHPDEADKIGDDNLVTDGNRVLVLSDEHKQEFEKHLADNAPEVGLDELS